MSFPKLMYMEKTHMHVMSCNAYNVNFHTLTADGVPIDISGHTTPGPPGPQGAQGITGPKGPMGGTGPAGGDDAIPVGSILIWPSANPPPPDYLLCDGATYNPGTYPDLYNVIGTTYGGTPAAPLLPDLRGRNIFGECESLFADECGVFDVSRASLISDISSNGVGDDKIPASQLWKHRHSGLDHNHPTNPRNRTDDANPLDGCPNDQYWSVGNLDPDGTYGLVSPADASHPPALIDNAHTDNQVHTNVKETRYNGGNPVTTPDSFVSPALVIHFMIKVAVSV